MVQAVKKNKVQAVKPRPVKKVQAKKTKTVAKSTKAKVNVKVAPKAKLAKVTPISKVDARAKREKRAIHIKNACSASPCILRKEATYTQAKIFSRLNNKPFFRNALSCKFCSRKFHLGCMKNRISTVELIVMYKYRQNVAWLCDDCVTDLNSIHSVSTLKMQNLSLRKTIASLNNEKLGKDPNNVQPDLKRRMTKRAIKHNVVFYNVAETSSPKNDFLALRKILATACGVESAVSENTMYRIGKKADGKIRPIKAAISDLNNHSKILRTKFPKLEDAKMKNVKVSRDRFHAIKLKKAGIKTKITDGKVVILSGKDKTLFGKKAQGKVGKN